MKVANVLYDEDFFIALRPDTLQAQERREIATRNIVGRNADIEHFQRRLAAALKVPAEYLFMPDR